MMLTKIRRPHQNKRYRKHWLAGWLLLSTAVLFWVVIQANAQETIPYQVYLARISRYRTQIQNAASCEVYGQIADELEAVTAVQMPDGTIMPVQHDGADRALRGSCHKATADSYLAGLCPTNLCKPGPAQLTQPSEPPEAPSLDDFSNEMGNLDELPPIDPETGRASPPTNNQNQSPQPATENNNTTGANSNPQPAPADNNTVSEQPGADNSAPNLGEGAAANGSDDPTNGEVAPDGSNEAASGADGGTGEAAPDSAAAGEGSPNSEQPGAENSADADGETGASGSNSAGAEGTTGEIPGGENSAAPAPAQNAENQEPVGTDSTSPELAPETAVQTPLPIGTFILIGSVVLILILIIILLIIYIRSRQNEEEPAKKPRPKPSPAVKKQLDEGRKKVEQGEYREAVRKLFLAALITLNEEGAIQYDTTLTNMELLKQGVLRPSLIQPLTPVIDTYERVWYGYEPLQTPEYESLVNQIHKLREKVSDEYQQVMSNED